MDRWNNNSWLENALGSFLHIIIIVVFTTVLRGGLALLSIVCTRDRHRLAQVDQAHLEEA